MIVSYSLTLSMEKNGVVIAAMSVNGNSPYPVPKNDDPFVYHHIDKSGTRIEYRGKVGAHHVELIFDENSGSVSLSQKLTIVDAIIAR